MKEELLNKKAIKKFSEVLFTFYVVRTKRKCCLYLWQNSTIHYVCCWQMSMLGLSIGKFRSHICTLNVLGSEIWDHIFIVDVCYMFSSLYPTPLVVQQHSRFGRIYIALGRTWDRLTVSCTHRSRVTSCTDLSLCVRLLVRLAFLHS